MLSDFSEQRDHNRIPRMTFETETFAPVFGDLFVPVPVSIEYSVSARNNIQDVRNVTVRVAGIHEYPWEYLPHYEKEAWRREMIDAWNAKYGLVLQRISA